MSKRKRALAEKIDRACAFCENASTLRDKDFMLCQKFGVVSAGHICRRFSYDPLKRLPAPRRIISEEISPEMP